MRDGVDFAREVARFSDKDVGYIVDLLRGVYKTLECNETYADTGDSEGKLFLGDFIEALENADCIDIVADEEYLVDAD